MKLRKTTYGQLTGLFPVSGPTPAKPSGDHIPPGGFGLRSAALETQANSSQIGFQIVCTSCDGLGVSYQGAELAHSFTPISCRHCGAPRGTLGDLRRLSVSGTQDLFDI